jgi:asparagine synthase (glutamine-hydrolysing)
LNQIFSEAIDLSQEFKQNDIINKSLYLDCKILLPDWYLVKGDRATMCNSLEMRNPFLDKDLAEFLFSLSGKWKVRNGVTKYVLKKIAAQYIDPQIIYRPKGGFGVPLDKWIKTELKPLFMPSPFFNRAYVEKIFREHLSGQRDNQFLLLRIFNLNYFLNKYHAS